MVFSVERLEKSSVHGVVWATSAEFKTEAEAKAEVAKLQEADRSVNLRIKEVERVQKAIPGTDVVEVVKTREERAAEAPPTTRTKKEQERVEEKARRLAEIERQRRTGKITERQAIELREIQSKPLPTPKKEIITQERFEEIKAEEKQRRVLETEEKLAEKEGRIIEPTLLPASKGFYKKIEESTFKEPSKVMSEKELKDFVDRSRGLQYAKWKPPKGTEDQFKTKEIMIGPLQKPSRLVAAPPRKKAPFKEVTGELLVKSGEPLRPGGLTLVGAVREKEGPIISGVRSQVRGIFPRSPFFTETVVGKIKRTTRDPIKEIVPPLAIGVGFGLVTAIAPPVGIGLGLGAGVITTSQVVQAPSSIARQQMAGELVTDIPFLVAGGRLGGAVKPFLPRPTTGQVSIPTKTGDTTIKSFGLRVGTKALPIVTKTPRGLKFGRTDISPELTQLKTGVDIKIGGALETTLIKRGLTKKGIEPFKLARRLEKEGKARFEFLPEKQFESRILELTGEPLQKVSPIKPGEETLGLFFPKSRLKLTPERIKSGRTVPEFIETVRKSKDKFIRVVGKDEVELTPEILIKTTVSGKSIPRIKQKEILRHEIGHLRTSTHLFKGLKKVETRLRIPSEFQPTEFLAERLKPNVGIKVTKRGMEAISPAQKILIKTRRTKAKVTGLPEVTERLGPKATEIVLDIAREEEAVVFGSFARKAQNPAGRLPRDIDIRVDKATGPDIQRITTMTVKRLREVEPTVRLRKDMPGVVEIKRGKVFEKAVEFKGKEPIVKGEEVPEEILGLQKVSKPIKVEGQKITSLSEELRGVTQGVIRVRKEPSGALDIFPPPKRVKDISSLFESVEVLKESRIIRSPRLEKEITKLKSLFPEGLVKPTDKIRIADFRPSPKARAKPILRTEVVSPVSQAISPTQRVISPSPMIRSVSPRISPVSPKSFSPRVSVSASPRPSVSKSVSPSGSVSVFPSLSKSISRSISPGKSISKSISPSKSVSVSFSPSLSVSRSRSLSASYSVSPSPSPSPSVFSFTPTPPPPFFIPPFGRPKIKKKRKKIKMPFKRKFRGTPSLSNILYGGGTQLTRQQIAGKEYISPLLIRKMGRRI